MRIETRLHRARIERGIDLTDLAARTRLSPHIVKKIDEGRFAELPPGVYARAYVRAFADAVGLEPVAMLQELEDVLPRADDPLDGLRQTVRQTRWTPRQTTRIARAAAAVFDAAVLVAVNAGCVHLIAATCGVAVPSLLQQAGAAISMFCAIPVVLYFVVFGGVGGRTPGAWLCGLGPSAAPSPLRLGTILTRTVTL